jgi:hypothetical protein
MNKDLASEIIKVANSLDALGFVKEANSLDNIARKVISQVAVPEPARDYTKDILTYKKLLYQDIDNPTPAKEFLRKVMDKNYLSPQQSFAFSAQTERLGKMRKMTEENRSKVNELLYNKVQKYDLDKPNISETDFEKNWEKTKLTKKDLNSPSLGTYNILRARFRNPKV